MIRNLHTFVVVVMTGKQGCAGGGDAGLQIFELSAPWRIGDLKGWRGGGGEGPSLLSLAVCGA